MGGVAQLAGQGAAIAFGLALFLGGFFHGAAEEQGGTLRAFRLLDAAAYVVAALAIAALFLSLPLAGLTLFLLLSAWHFHHSRGGGTAGRWAYALLAVGGSALWRPETTARIFAALTGDPIPNAWMLAMGVAGAAGVALAAWALLRNPRDAALWITLAATALLHPVLAVGLAFFVGQALPMQLAQARRYGWAQTWRAAAPTAIPAILGALVLVGVVLAGQLALPIAAALALGMAGPHILTERLER